MTALDALTLARSEVAALLAERDQLLAERDQLRAEVERAHTDERRRIVAWIRHEVTRHTGGRGGVRVVATGLAPSTLAFARDLADSIERGAHEWPASMPSRVADAMAVAERLDEGDR